MVGILFNTRLNYTPRVTLLSTAQNEREPSVMVILSAKAEQAPLLSPLAKYWVFTGLILTAIISSLPLAGDVQKWILPRISTISLRTIQQQLR
jgi:hypothetical protein